MKWGIKEKVLYAVLKVYELITVFTVVYVLPLCCSSLYFTGNSGKNNVGLLEQWFLGLLCTITIIGITVVFIAIWKLLPEVIEFIRYGNRKLVNKLIKKD